MSRGPSLPSFDFPMEGLQPPLPLPGFAKSGKTNITTLPNGVKIVSARGPKGPGPKSEVSIGLYVDCGSVHERPISSGVSKFLEGMAFSTTTNRSYQRIEEEMKAVGVNMMTARAFQEQMAYSICGSKTNLPIMVELLVDCVRNPAFLECEVNEKLRDFKYLTSVLSKDPGGLLMEALHCTGYSGALANPFLAPESAICRLNSTILKGFVSENYTAPRMVLSAVGLEHADLVSIAAPLLSDMPAVPLPEAPKSLYVGGDYRRQAGSGITHFALAFEGPGGRSEPKEASALTVLQALMEGGSNYSSSGNRNGRSSRLYSRVLTKYPQIRFFYAFSSIHYDSALFGIRATTSSNFVSKAFEITVKELLAIATPGDVSPAELHSAKAYLKTTVLKQSESTIAECEIIGRETLLFGKRRPVEYVLKALDEVTVEDIARLAGKMFSSPLTMVSYGDVCNVPSYEEVSSRFNSK